MRLSIILRKYDGRLCSVCELLQVKRCLVCSDFKLVSKGGINAVTDGYYKKLGDEHFDKLIDMFVFDAVVCLNRHFGNFGVLVDNPYEYGN